MDLWVRDLSAQVRVVRRFCLVAPVTTQLMAHLAPLPSGVHVIARDELDASTESHLAAVLSDYDVVQVHGGRPSWQSHLEARLISAARRQKRCTIYGISSDRARTALLNAEGGSLLRRAKASIVANSIRRTQRRQALACDGLFLIGEGLAKSYGYGHHNIHIDIASWINRDDILNDASLHEKYSVPSVLRLCVASRLEPMKGVHLAVQALKHLHCKNAAGSPSLAIMGNGPELDTLRNLGSGLGLSQHISFRGTYAYGKPFYEALRQFDLLLMPNLNDEQPRVIFDAIAQGVLPVCPNLPAYLALGIDSKLIYQAGDPESMAEVVQGLQSPEVRMELLRVIRPLAHHHTLERMHEERAEWIRQTINCGAIAAASCPFT
ncbi:MAG: glycosyltransferase [Bacillota bacterium]